ncbi:MAG: cytochrome C oxidase subunit IV family protein [Gemmatimonadales bacterium]
MHAPSHGGHGEHAHPKPVVYLKIAVVLFILTAFEVMAFEAGRGGFGETLRPIFEPIVVLILVVFSGAKFVLVALYYMHLKQDPKLLTNLFLWPIVIAAVVIGSLIVLLQYWRVVGGMAIPQAALQ